MDIILCNLKIVEGTGRNVGSFCMDGHYLGPKIVAVIQSRGMTPKQGFHMYYSNDDGIGTEVSVRYRSGHLSEVVVKRGFAVQPILLQHGPTVRYTSTVFKSDLSLIGIGFYYTTAPKRSGVTCSINSFEPLYVTISA